MRILDLVLSASASVLLIVSVIGDFSSLNNYKNTKPLSFEVFKPELVSQIRSVDNLIDYAKSKTQDFNQSLPRKKMELLYQAVTERFSHGTGATHNIFSNWILYATSFVHPVFGIIFDEEKMVEQGHSVVCSQSSYLLMKIALKNGIPARHVGLNGHVVMEAFYDDDWHLYDPDLEVIPYGLKNNVLSVMELARSKELLKQYYLEKSSEIVEIIRTQHDNSYASFPLGVYFEWKSEVLLHLERVCEIMKYLIPFCIFLIGLFRIYLNKNRETTI